MQGLENQNSWGSFPQFRRGPVYILEYKAMCVLFMAFKTVHLQNPIARSYSDWKKKLLLRGEHSSEKIDWCNNGFAII